MKKCMPDHAAMLRRGWPLRKEKSGLCTCKKPEDRCGGRPCPPKRHLAWEEAPVCKGERSGSERSAPCEEDQDLRAAVNSECPANRGFPRASLRPRLRKPTQSLSPAAPTSPRLRTSVESQLAAGSHENPCFAQLSDPIDAQYRTGAVQCRTRAAPKETVTAQSRPPQ